MFYYSQFFILLLQNDDGVESTMVTWLMGIAILTFALFLSARMGIYQECLYGKHGKHPHEALFYIVSLK